MANRNELNYREIVTKAICGKGKKFTEDRHVVIPEYKPSTVLGCWIINHKYSAEKNDDYVDVQGSYDINVWLSYENNTKTDVATQSVNYTDKIKLRMSDEHILSDDLDIIARVVQQPTTLEATIAENGEEVHVQVEREFVVECMGETKVAVAVNPNGMIELDIEEDYGSDDVKEEEYERLNPNFLRED